MLTNRYVREDLKKGTKCCLFQDTQQVENVGELSKQVSGTVEVSSDVCYTLFVVHAVVIVISRGQVEMNFQISGSQGRT